VAAWNARALPARFYVGMAGRAMKRTQHNWGIQLGARRPCAADVGARRLLHDPFQGAPCGADARERAAGAGMAAALDDERAAAGAERADARAADAAARKDWRAEQRLALDEMLPKATGRCGAAHPRASAWRAARPRVLARRGGLQACPARREARVDAKVARREAAHERDASPDVVKLPGGGDVMGGGDSFAAARAAQAARRAAAAAERMCCGPGAAWGRAAGPARLGALV